MKYVIGKKIFNKKPVEHEIKMEIVAPGIVKINFLKLSKMLEVKILNLDQEDYSVIDKKDWK